VTFSIIGIEIFLKPKKYKNQELVLRTLVKHAINSRFYPSAKSKTAKSKTAKSKTAKSKTAKSEAEDEEY
jgi:hypothetical protein